MIDWILVSQSTCRAIGKGLLTISGYRIREKREAHEFFRTGRVFAMLWAESASATMTRGGTENTAVTIGRFGEQVFSQIRRFVVVRVNRDRHFVYAWYVNTYRSRCGIFLTVYSAISTYGGQGTLKHGCNAAEHTIVYLEGTNPVRLEGEWERGMVKDPIMIIPTNPQETMGPSSRLRCGKIYSIEWNVKLKEIGMVAAHDKTKLMQYFAEEQDNGFDLDDNESGRQSQHYYHQNTPAMQSQNYYHQNTPAVQSQDYYHQNTPAMQPQNYYSQNDPAMRPQYRHHSTNNHRRRQ